MIVSAIRPPSSPARMDSIGNPGTGDGGIDVVVAVEVVALECYVRNTQANGASTQRKVEGSVLVT